MTPVAPIVIAAHKEMNDEGNLHFEGLGSSHGDCGRVPRLRASAISPNEINIGAGAKNGPAKASPAAGSSVRGAIGQ